MRITREEAATLTAKGAQKAVQARSPVLEGWQGGVLTIFVPGRPWNPLNGGQRSYMKHARLRKAWRERTASRLLAWIQRPAPVPRYGRDPGVPPWIVNPEAQS